jgi:cyclophilin family peptidyl-prolyl cis-trans isomerase
MLWRPRSFFAVLSLLGLLLTTAPTVRADGAELCRTAAEQVCPPDRRPVLVWTTERGRLELELFPEAAPRAVAFIARLARGPIFLPELFAAGSDTAQRAEGIGFYDGLSFEHSEPRVLISTGSRPPSELFSTPTCIDAAELGLDGKVIADAAEAMEVMQRELLPEIVRHKKVGGLTPQLQAWSERWKASYQADFLVGVSRRSIQEALGYVYQAGLASLPPRRGAVALRPLSATESSARVAILLADLPDRTGRWMVIGRVVHGLEVADAISLQPLVAEPGQRSSTPLRPIVINEATLECRLPGADRS